MKFTIAKAFEFSASHQLAGLPADHQCTRLHGHNYAVELELGAEALDTTGFVLDYGDLARFKRYLDTTFDHRHLNDLMDENPTAEHMARLLWEVAHELLWEDPDSGFDHDDLLERGVAVLAVRVRETPKTVAEYRPGTDDA